MAKKAAEKAAAPAPAVKAKPAVAVRVSFSLENVDVTGIVETLRQIRRERGTVPPVEAQALAMTIVTDARAHLVEQVAEQLLKAASK